MQSHVKFRFSKAFYLLIFLLVISPSVIVFPSSVQAFPFGREKETKQIEEARWNKVPTIVKSCPKRKLRVVGNTMLSANALLLLGTGDNAFPALISSMVASKIIAETNEIIDDKHADAGSLKAFIGVTSSGIASLMGWLLKRMTMDQTENNANSEGAKTEETVAEKANKIENPLLRAFLLLGSRGMELTGGILLIFIQLMNM
ncbi:predicted protein [Chaetoceros tenuissimus]|uniref:Uncharacterized protein n=1 Tax=Chaetoceros tenuissimus TaxID=426638 RepID=A0AAD3CUA0_9STRA|nr:predicted protein [Chaetoceros tenuissimus]